MFEGIWQAYFKRWYDTNLPKVRTALDVPCNLNWKTVDNKRANKQCSKYRECIRKTAYRNLALLYEDMKRLDRIHAGSHIEYLEGGKSWRTGWGGPKDPNEYMSTKFIPYPETEYDWEGLSFSKCNQYK